jgi:Sulfotransferase family
LTSGYRCPDQGRPSGVHSSFKAAHRPVEPIATLRSLGKRAYLRLQRLAGPDVRIRNAPDRAVELEAKLAAMQGQLRELESIYICAAKFTLRVRQPLVLISQPPRSGGTLLSQLFDGHGACLAHPYELGIGYPSSGQWPILDLDADPERWWEILREAILDRQARQGYAKSTGRRYRFFFLTGLQRSLFLRDIAGRKSIGQREILDAYFTSYFSAWLDFGNRSGRKRYVTGFVPDLALDQASVDRFFQTYPDGKLISLVRDPVSWFVSCQSHFRARARASLLKSEQELIGEWRSGVSAAIRNRARYGASILVYRYEDLVSSPELVMRSIADELKIKFSPVLLTPTFNGMPIGPNSALAIAEGAQRGRISTTPLVRGAALDDATTVAIRAATDDLLAAVQPLVNVVVPA